MIEVKSKKPLLEAIQNGEQNIKVTDPKFLLACLVAEKCDNDKSNVKKFLNVIFGSKNGIFTQDRPQIRVGVVNEKGKVRWLFVNLTICSTALGILDILNPAERLVDVHAGLVHPRAFLLGDVTEEGVIYDLRLGFVP